MKNLFIYFIVFMLFMLFTSCDTDKMLSRTDQYYKVVKLIVTDPGVWDVLDEDQKAALKIADKSYKEARKIAKSAGDKKSYAKVLAVGVGVLDMLSDYNLISDRHKKEISIIRTSLNVYLVFLQDPE